MLHFQKTWNQDQNLPRIVMDFKAIGHEGMHYIQLDEFSVYSCSHNHSNKPSDWSKHGENLLSDVQL
jgi:hypothetical protein